MSHEPIDLKDADWPSSRPLVEYELNRIANNIHDLRNDMHATGLKHTDRLSIFEAIVNTVVVRISVLEVKVGLYGLVAGAIGSVLMNWFLKKL